MKLDEAIKHEEELVNEYEGYAKKIREKMKSEISLSNADDFDKYARQHRQLAEWLKELKKFRERQPYEKFENTKDHIYKLAGDYKCWDNRLTEDEAVELCHMLEQEPCEDLCKSCDTKGCLFQSGIKRKKCDFYTHEKESCEDWHEIPSYEMTLEQARQAVRDLRKFVMDNHILPKLQPCDDCISRQAVLDYIEGSEAELGHSSENELVCQDIKEFPSVTPTRKKGHWIIIDDCEQFIAKCSECGRIEDSRMISKYPYCHCGAKMESEVKE